MLACTSSHLCDIDPNDRPCCHHGRCRHCRKLSELRRGEREALVAALARFELAVTGHEGYGKAEVTGGGVPLNQLDCATLESRLAPGVHVCGELCDVFGRWVGTWLVVHQLGPGW